MDFLSIGVLTFWNCFVLAMCLWLICKNCKSVDICGQSVAVYVHRILHQKIYLYSGSSQNIINLKQKFHSSSTNGATLLQDGDLASSKWHWWSAAFLFMWDITTMQPLTWVLYCKKAHRRWFALTGTVTLIDCSVMGCYELDDILTNLYQIVWEGLQLFGV